MSDLILIVIIIIIIVIVMCWSDKSIYYIYFGGLSASRRQGRGIGKEEEMEEIEDALRESNENKFDV